MKYKSSKTVRGNVGMSGASQASADDKDGCYDCVGCANIKGRTK
jgi:hypothetical protein